ncbi:MAG: Ig-like domain-containing protein [Bacteroidota bacterium]
MEQTNFIKRLEVGDGISQDYVGSIYNHHYFSIWDSLSNECLLIETDEDLVETASLPIKIDDARNLKLVSICNADGQNKLLGGYEQGHDTPIILKINILGEIVWSKRYDIVPLENPNPGNISTLTLGPNYLIKAIHENKFLIYGIGGHYLITIDAEGSVANTIVFPFDRRRITDLFITENKIIVSFGSNATPAGLAYFDFDLNVSNYLIFKLASTPSKSLRSMGMSILDGQLTLMFAEKGSGSTDRIHFIQLDISHVLPTTYTSTYFIEEKSRVNKPLLSAGNLIFKVSQHELGNHVLHKFDRQLNHIDSKLFPDLRSFGMIPNDINVGSTSILFSAAIENHSKVFVKSDHDILSFSCLQRSQFSESLTLETTKINGQNESTDLVAPINRVNVIDLTATNSTHQYQYYFSRVCPEVSISKNKSTISASPERIAANGETTSVITVELREENNDLIVQENYQVKISTTKGSISETTRLPNGKFTAVLTSASHTSTAIVTFTVDGVVFNNRVRVEFTGPIPIAETTSPQSPHIYLQAAGSTGTDGSVAGNHLRWAFLNKLGNQHLPKGNYATNQLNFNKPDDFVRIYRAPYLKNQVTIDLSTPPQLVDRANHLWRYEVDGNKYHVHFRNTAQFETVRASVDPRANPTGFIQQYGANLIEVESRNALAFSAEVVTSGSGTGRSLKTELLAVEENKLSATQRLIARKSFGTSQLNNTYQVAENIKSIRFVPEGGAVPSAVHFELYSDQVATGNTNLSWVSIGEFALTKDDATALDRLEQEADTIHGSWPRYTNQAKVNVDNYRDRWNGPRDAEDRNLKDLVTQYISLSDGPNPKSLEVYPATASGETEVIEDQVELSNFDLLYINSIDYHNARMLGLAAIDAFTEDQKFIYLAEYHTNGDLGDGQGARPVQHVYVSLPTGKSDERLPLGVNLASITPGVPTIDRAVPLTNPEGYTPDGKKRFLSLYTDELPDRWWVLRV